MKEVNLRDPLIVSEGWCFGPGLHYGFTTLAKQVGIAELSNPRYVIDNLLVFADTLVLLVQ
jgi:hypothetical protein